MDLIKNHRKRCCLLMGLAVSVIWLGSCANDGGGGYAPSASATRQAIGSSPAAPKLRASFEESRPGIATGWGHDMRSRMGYTEFVRTAKPAGVALIRYNDSKGAKAMGVSSNYWNKSGMQRAANGLVSWGVKSRGWLLKNESWRNERFVTGTHGRKYSLVVKNLAESRLEVVLTVDGLDVIDGKTGNLKKRGYIVYPGKTLEVKGYRRSIDTVAAFKFSTVRDSYVNQRHGSTRNVGVMGLAVFTEKGVDPWKERVARQRARAFAEEPLFRAKSTTD